MTFMLLAAAVVLVPARVLPREAAERIDGRRELLLFIGLCGLGIGFALTLLITVASS